MDDTVIRGYKAAEEIHHRYLTGIILRTVMTRGAQDATELVFRLFRRQQQEKFLPGLKKLGLEGLPDAVACGRYHYLSNYLGDVNVAYFEQSERKTWVRYPPPRWIWDGTAICAIPTECSRAMMRAWHSYNGVTLENPRLGFVCTSQTTDGQPGLEGYFCEYDDDLRDDERLRFAPEEASPDFTGAEMPSLDTADWPEERVRKALRNYAMEYVRNILPEMVKLFGPDEAHHLGRVTGKLIGMQYYAQTKELLGIDGDTPEAFGAFMVALGTATGDTIETATENGEVFVRQTTWRLMRDLPDLHPAAFDAWNGLWEGFLATHDRFLALQITKRFDYGDDCIEWRVCKP